MSFIHSSYQLWDQRTLADKLANKSGDKARMKTANEPVLSHSLQIQGAPNSVHYFNIELFYLKVFQLRPTCTIS